MAVPNTAARPTRAFLLTVALLAFGISPLPDRWARTVRQTLRSAELNRADREANAGGYYEGLIGGGSDGGRDDLAVRIQGKPVDWVRFSDIGATRTLIGDPIQFDLKPDVDKVLFGQPFTTNAFGLRDRPTTLAKPSGTFRIVLLGSSMDMGWGVGTDQTYENQLEDWLNVHAAKRGSHRRFEVLNFAVAAYSPLQRYDTLIRKALPFEPDMVIYSATMLDLRLLQIHLCNLFQARTDATHGILKQAVQLAQLTPEDLRLTSAGMLVKKEAVKAKLQPHLWALDDAIIGDLAGACRDRNLPLICVMIPRVGEADSPAGRADAVKAQAEIATRHGIPIVDLTGTFDERDAAEIEIAPWDDHPNALGHKLLFRAFAQHIVDNGKLYNILFNEPAPPATETSTVSTILSARNDTRADQGPAKVEDATSQREKNPLPVDREARLPARTRASQR